MKRIQCILSLLILAISVPAWAGDDGLSEAIQRGDWKTAHEICLPKAEQGNYGAQWLIGRMYEEGNFVQKNYTEAVKWYRKAVAQGYHYAQNSLAIMYMRGKGVPKDMAKAIELYRKAAEQGFSDAQLNLGLMFYHGNGVPKDNVKAYMWWTLAAAQGMKQAAQNREIVTKEMSRAQIADAQQLAREWRPKKETAPATPKSAKKPARKSTPSGKAMVALKKRAKLMEPEILLGTINEFWDIAKKDPDLACALFMTIDAELAFAPVMELTGIGLNYFFNAAVLEMCYQSPVHGMVAFYNPWVDVILITAWRVENDRPMIYDTELLTGDFLRHSGVPPYDVIPLWLRDGKDPPPDAVVRSTNETMKVFRVIMSRALPGHWRLEITNLENPDLLAINNAAAALMFSDRLSAFSAFIREKSQRPLRDATFETLDALREGRVQEVLDEARSTPPAAGMILKDFMKGRWNRTDVVSTARVKNGDLVFLTMPDWPTCFLSFFFKTDAAKAVLERIDVVSLQDSSFNRAQ